MKRAIGKQIIAQETPSRALHIHGPAQLGERRSDERGVVSSDLGRTNTQGLKITEGNVLSL